MMALLYYGLLFCLFLAALLIGLNISMLVLGDIFGLMLWVIFVSFLLASLYDDGEPL